MENMIGELKLQLMGYFGGGVREDEEVIAELSEDMKGYPGTARAFREGIAQALADPAADCVDLVERGANRAMEGSDEKARRWLAHLRSRLFPGEAA
ncbi:MAG: hypothetical protein HY924_12780 [Elusimicrobia bacterium]|nr:hypothetical protein [Elusimicrobiota bacterium]